MRIGFGTSAGAGGEGGGGGGDEPPPDVYEAVIACIEDVGRHEERNMPGVTKQKIVVGLEVDWTDSKGRKPRLFKKFNANLWASADGKKKSSLREFFDIIAPGDVSKAFSEGREIDTSKYVGGTVRVTVEHDARGRATIRGFVKTKLAPNALKVYHDWSQPFGLWKWLLENKTA